MVIDNGGKRLKIKDASFYNIIVLFKQLMHIIFICLFSSNSLPIYFINSYEYSKVRPNLHIIETYKNYNAHKHISIHDDRAELLLSINNVTTETRAYYISCVLQHTTIAIYHLHIQRLQIPLLVFMVPSNIYIYTIVQGTLDALMPNIQ